MGNKNLTRKWHDSYNLGILDIDLQHQILFQLINRIYYVCQQPELEQFKSEAFKEFFEFARFHFWSEEGMMRRSGYPNFESHSKIHDELIKELSVQQKKQFEDQITSEPDAILIYFYGWFFQHAREADRQFANFLMDKNYLVRDRALLHPI